MTSASANDQLLAPFYRSFCELRTLHIFIDETGRFSGIGQPLSISMIGALVVPDSRLSSLQREYRRIRPSLLKGGTEVKGRQLHEKQIASLIPMLHFHDVLFEVVGIDLGLHTLEGLEESQRQRAEALTASLTDEHHSNLVEWAWGLRREFEGHSLPLKIQSSMMFELLKDLLELPTMYFSQRKPKELANFHWVIDAKGILDTPNDWERWWSMCVLPALQTRCAHDPVKSIKIGDYRHMKRFHMDDLGEFHKALFGFPKPGAAPPVDLKLMLTESRRFSSQPEEGLELVDILTNATRRALVGNLKEDGWRDICRLMIARKPQSIRLLSMDDNVPTSLAPPYTKVVKAFDRAGRPMLAHHNRNKKF